MEVAVDGCAICERRRTEKERRRRRKREERADGGGGLCRLGPEKMIATRDEKQERAKDHKRIRITAREILPGNLGGTLEGQIPALTNSMW